MKKFMNIISEGMDPRANHPAFTPDDNGDGDVATGEKPEEMLDFEKMFDQIFAPLHNLRNRMSIEDVYYLVLDGIPFNDAVGHIAKRDNMDASHLHSLVVDDYKLLRGRGETYDSSLGHSLVSRMNQFVRESLDEAVAQHDAALMERGMQSLKVGAYSNKSGESLSVLRAEHEPNHHMVVNKKGEVVKSKSISPEELHRELTADGFIGAIHESKLPPKE